MDDTKETVFSKYNRILYTYINRDSGSMHRACTDSDGVPTLIQGSSHKLTSLSKKILPISNYSQRKNSKRVSLNILLTLKNSTRA